MSKQTEKIQELIELRAKARLGGGEKAIEKQHERGKYTARERIAMLKWQVKDLRNYFENDIRFLRQFEAAI